MQITLRTNGTENYLRTKVSKKVAQRLESEGHFDGYNHIFGYIEGEYESTRFTSRGVNYKIKYFSGCFYPFLSYVENKK